MAIICLSFHINLEKEVLLSLFHRDGGGGRSAVKLDSSTLLKSWLKNPKFDHIDFLKYHKNEIYIYV